MNEHPPASNALPMNDAAATLTALAASFETQHAVLTTHTGAPAPLRPGLTAAAREATTSAYRTWLQAMIAECMRLSAACLLAASSHTEATGPMIPSATAIENRVAQESGGAATNFMGINTPLIDFLHATYVTLAISLYRAQVIAASAPLPLPPPPPLWDPAAPPSRRSPQQ